eukprot:gene10612-11759_t
MEGEREEKSTFSSESCEEEAAEPVQLDALGPVIINSDGTVSRIANWHTLTEEEQKKTFRLISKRNQARRAKLEAAPPVDEIAAAEPQAVDLPALANGD